MADDKEKVEEHALDDFSWDSPEEEAQKAAAEETSTETTEETPKDGGEDNEIDWADPDSEEKEEKEEKSDEDDKETDDKDEKDEFEVSDEDKETKIKWDSLYGDMKETEVFEAFLSTKEGDDFKVESQEDLVEAIDSEVDARFNETINTFMDELDEDGKAFLAFKKNGGDTKEFMKTMKSISETPDFDIDNESDHKSIVEHYYKNFSDMTNEEITDQLEFLEEKGKIESYAKNFDGKIKKHNKMQKEQMIASAEAKTQENKERNEAFVENISEVLKGKEGIKGVKLSPMEKKDLQSFMTKASVKVGPNNFVTPFQKKMSEFFKDDKNRENLVMLAYMVKNDLSLDGIEKKLGSKATKKLSKKLSADRYTDTKSKTSKKATSLADQFA